MQYPTLEEVESADRIQLARWYRFLPSPGTRATGERYRAFKKLLVEEKIIMDRIAERFQAFGGLTPEISKTIGWEE